MFVFLANPYAPRPSQLSLSQSSHQVPTLPFTCIQAPNVPVLSTSNLSTSVTYNRLEAKIPRLNIFNSLFIENDPFRLFLLILLTFYRALKSSFTPNHMFVYPTHFALQLNIPIHSPVLPLHCPHSICPASAPQLKPLSISDHVYNPQASFSWHSYIIIQSMNASPSWTC